MLKWTASAQKLNVLEMAIQTPIAPPSTSTTATTTATTRLTAAMRTPQQQQQRRQRQRRATIAHNGCDKENIQPVTSTPIVRPTAATAASQLRVRNSPLVLAPLADILNVTPETASPQTPQSRRRRSVISVAATPTPIFTRGHTRQPNRRHSTVGFSQPAAHEYAPTLPCYEEEEYSPSARALPTGQELALRGLMPAPVPFLTTMRYFQTPELLNRQQQCKRQTAATTSSDETFKAKKSVPQKRKLEQEFAEIEECGDEECHGANAGATMRRGQRELTNVTSTTSSTKMGDQTLDRLIDAILDSARKEEKHKKPRKSFNLRRRTLLKNQTEHAVQEVLLSPSYAAGDDPASDLSFLLCETALDMPANRTPALLRRSLTLFNTTPKQQTQQQSKQRQQALLPRTPAPVTPLPGTPIPLAVLQQMPTPAVAATIASSIHNNNNNDRRTLKSIVGHANDSFNLETPVRALTKRRRQHQHHHHQQQHDQHELAELADERDEVVGSATKKFKGETHNYFEVGLALPSIYV